MNVPSIRVSVVVPTYRRPDLLERCLGALCVQHFDPARYEIIVADDDGGNPAVRALAARLDGPVPVRYVAVTATQGL
ncbi:MAG: glycosyltransferase, partial [Burkholderiaceae bacterium]